MSKLLELNDPKFGRLQFINEFWGGLTSFRPTDSEIEVYIDAGEKGPDENHHESFDMIERKYIELKDQVLVNLQKAALERYRGDIDFKENTFILLAVFVPRDLKADTEWQLMYESDLPGKPYLNVIFEGWRATGEIEMSV